jgi:NADPH-dependent 2,4-dienoyl-CoA reductase/sulfur reductase-like enzyme
VALIERGDGLLLSALGTEMASCWAKLHRDHGVDLRVGVHVDAFAGNGRVEGVRLSDGAYVAADLVIAGLGVTPATGWLENSGLRVDDGLVCDAKGAVEGGHDIVAAGDIARWWHPRYERHLRIEHWDHAGRQGEAAARTLLAGPDHAAAYDELPYFWSDQYDVKMQMLGVPTDYDAFSVVEGRRPEDWAFTAAYGRDGRTIAVLSTIPGRVHTYRDAISAGTAFPPKPA